jgi:hypothetical protein
MVEEQTKRLALERTVHELRQALEKAWHVSNQTEDYFDLRDQNGFTDPEVEVVLLGYAGAALEHEMVHDYLTLALHRARELEAWL